MEFFKANANVDFLKIRKWTALLSLSLSVFSILTLGLKGLNWGLDFTGGLLIEIQYSQAPSLDRVRSELAEAGFKDVVVQQAGSTQDVLIRLADEHRVDGTQDETPRRVVKLLEMHDPKLILKRVDQVGAQVGSELAEQGALAILVALLLMGLYIAFRFEYRFAISAAISLAHDPILILGIFSLFQLEFDLTSLAAMLAVIGYSLNDTIVVFDRVKENFIHMKKGDPIEIVNASINQTLSRTIMTSVATLLVVLALLFLGGPSLYGFSLALVIGIVIGTYSSIYIAGALAVALGLNKKDLMKSKSSSQHPSGAVV